MRCFKGGDDKSIDKRLKADKEVNPKRIPYFVGGSREYPGKFLLYYMPGNRPKHEYISVVPEGLRFRTLIFKTADKLIHWFKVHYRDPPSAASAPGRSSSNRSGDHSSSSSSSSSGGGGGSGGRNSMGDHHHSGRNNNPRRSAAKGRPQDWSSKNRQRNYENWG